MDDIQSTGPEGNKIELWEADDEEYAKILKGLRNNGAAKTDLAIIGC